MLLADRRPGQDLDLDPAGGDVAALAPQLPATLGIQGLEKVGEVAVARVVPVILDAHAPQRRSAAAQRRGRGLLREQAVQGRQPPFPHELLGAVEELAGQGGALPLLGDQHAWSGDRRERDGADQLGVVAAAGALIGLGPRPVEDELAVRILLQVQRQRAHEAACGPGQQVHGHPAVRAQAIVLFHAVQEVVPQEGVIGVDHAVPVLPGHGAQIAGHFDGRGRAKVQIDVGLHAE